MPWKSVVYERSELFAEVWQEPVRSVAKKYGISDVALAKICRKLDVPLPGRGYWARKAARQDVPKTPLPPLKRGQAAQYTAARQFEPERPIETNGAVAALIEAEQDPSRAIVVPEVLAEPHPLVRMSGPILRRTSFGERAMEKERCLDMFVSKGTLDRAVRVMDSLLKALEARGFEIEVTECNNPDPIPRYSYERRPSRTGVRIGEQVVEFGIEEKTDSFKTPPPRPGSYEYRPPYERRPNGRLMICLRGRSYSGERQTWSDGSKQRIEGCLNSFVAALIATAETMRLETIRVEEERQRRQEAQREAQAAGRQHAAHEVLVHDLDERMTLLQKAKEIRVFVDLVATRASEDQATLQGSVQLADWLEWAKARAGRLEKRALTCLMTLRHDISGKSDLTARFGWSAKPTSGELLGVVFNPYMTGAETPDGEK